MDDDLLTIYRTRVESLTPMDQNAFGTALSQHRAGSEAAGRAISEATLRVALQAAEEYISATRDSNPLDVVQEANAALMHALQTFTGATLVEFEEHARKNVRASLALLG